MAKKDKATPASTNGSTTAISRSGVLVLDREQYEKAKVTKEYGKQVGGGLLPTGDYIMEVLDAEITVQEGTGITRGCDKYTLRLRADADENNGVGGIGYFRAIAHPNTGGQILNMLDAFHYPESAPGPDGLVTQELPTKKEIAAWVGTKVIGHVKNQKSTAPGAAEDDRELKIRLDPMPGSNGKAATNGKAKKQKIAK